MPLAARRHRALALASCVLPGVLSAPAAGSAEEQRRHALSDDDACAADDGQCALNALQARTGRSPPSKPAEDDGWVWPEMAAVRQMHGSEFSAKEYPDIYDSMSPVVNAQCLPYNNYYWPQVSFWTQEVLRRVEQLPTDMSPTQQKDLQHFARQASYLGCVWYYDPRIGNGNWSVHVAEHMQRVMDQPSTSLEMPDMPSYFSTLDGFERFKLMAVDACMMWMQAMTCDVGHFARDLKGNKDTGGKLCWDEVPVPPFGFSLFGMTFMPERGVHNESVVPGEYKRDEYLKCQEHPLTEESMTYCPMGGHWGDGMWNSTWGTPAEPGSQRRSDILTCNKKLDNPKFAHITPMIAHIADEGEDIDVLKPYRGYVLNYTMMSDMMDKMYNTPRAEYDEKIANMKKQAIEGVAKYAAKQAVKGVLSR